MDGSTGEIGQHTESVEESGSVDMFPQEVTNEQKVISGETRTQNQKEGRPTLCEQN